MNKQYGNFINGENEFKITERDIPRNWYNYLWNDRYITFVSQTGTGNGFVQDNISNRINNLSGRVMYLVENGAHWGITGLSADERLDGYSCTHDLGYTDIETENFGIKSQVRFLSRMMMTVKYGR